MRSVNVPALGARYWAALILASVFGANTGDFRRAIAGSDVDPEALSGAERKQCAGRQRRDGVNGMVRSLHGQGQSIEGLVRATGVSRQTVRRLLAGTRDGLFRSRSSMLERWAERLSAEWDGGCRNGAELWRRLRSAGAASAW